MEDIVKFSCEDDLADWAESVDISIGMQPEEATAILRLTAKGGMFLGYDDDDVLYYAENGQVESAEAIEYEELLRILVDYGEGIPLGSLRPEEESVLFLEVALLRRCIDCL